MIDETSTKNEARAWILGRLRDDVASYNEHRARAERANGRGDREYVEVCAIYVTELDRAIAAIEGKREAALIRLLRENAGTRWDIERAIAETIAEMEAK